MSYREEILRIYRHDGIKGFSYGYRPMIVRDMISFGCYFLFYDALRHSFYDTFTFRLLAGGTAGVLAWGLAYPFDSLKLRMQTGLVDPNLSIWRALKLI